MKFLPFIIILVIDSPGPQSYNLPPLLNGNGHIFCSKFKSSPATTISKEQRSQEKIIRTYFIIN